MQDTAIKEKDPLKVGRMFLLRVERGTLLWWMGTQVGVWRRS